MRSVCSDAGIMWRIQRTPRATNVSDNAIIVAFLADAEPVALANDRGHQLRAGRPNVHALLRSALEGLGTQCLFAAACGPAALVETVRQTVVIAKQENSCTRLEFCGSSPRW